MSTTTHQTIGPKIVATLEVPDDSNRGAYITVPLIKIGCHGFPMTEHFALTPAQTRALILTILPITNSVHDPRTLEYVMNLSEEFFREALLSQEDLNGSFLKFKTDVSVYMMIQAYERFPEILDAHIRDLNDATGARGAPLSSEDLKNMIETITGDLEYLDFIINHPSEMLRFESYETGDTMQQKIYELWGSEQGEAGVYGKIMVVNIDGVYTKSKNRGVNGSLVAGNLLPQIMEVSPRKAEKKQVTLEDMLTRVTRPEGKNVPVVVVIDGSCNKLSTPSLAPIPATSKARIKLEEKTLLGIRAHNEAVINTLREKGKKSEIIDDARVYKELNTKHPNSGIMRNQIATLKSMIDEKVGTELSAKKKKSGANAGGSRKRRRTKRRRRPRARKTCRVYKRNHQK